MKLYFPAPLLRLTLRLKSELEISKLKKRSMNELTQVDIVKGLLQNFFLPCQVASDPLELPPETFKCQTGHLQSYITPAQLVTEIHNP